jgi:predicted O-methyltransferase YrrM
VFEKFEISKIPGMIEPVEQKLLYDIASQLSLQESDQYVEFGTFFGRSTACLAQGLLDNKTRSGKNKLHAYDSFSCALHGGFIEHVKQFAVTGNVQQLLKYDKDKIDFYGIFEHYLSKEIESEILVPIRSELDLSEPGKLKNIALIHIDSPKFYEELKVILFRFFPLLRDGAIIIFQDFFYHWSATLIAAVEAMRNAKLIEYRLSAASSLIVQINRPITLEDLFEIDIKMNSVTNVDKLLSDAISECSNITLDRKEIFLPRLWLASFQNLWSRGEFEKATDIFINYMQKNGNLSNNLLADLTEMMRQGFSTRSGYEKDRVGK